MWDLVSEIDLVTTGLQDYWENCLAVIPISGQDGILVPFLVWGPIPNFQVTGYKIYWNLNTQGGPPGTFSLLATVGANTCEYSHEGLSATGNWKAYYKIRAYNSSTESGYSDIAEISVGGFFKQGLGGMSIVNSSDHKLSQNYPNPFNPSTTIVYQLRQDAVVNLQVFNSIGEIIADLVNQKQKQGNYSFEFDGSHLASGIYFCRIQIDHFSDAKKMILLK